MKYTDQEIIDKFSKVDFDKTGLKKQAILTRVTQACAQRRTKSSGDAGNFLAFESAFAVYPNHDHAQCAV